MQCCNIIVLFISVLINKNDGARILGVYPTPSISHQVAFRPLTDELVKRGHDVTVITTDPGYTKGQTRKNLREIDVHEISYGIWRELLPMLGTGDPKDAIKQGQIALEMFSKIVDAQLKSPEVQILINNKNETFDLILVELCMRPALVFSHLFKAPVIYVSSLGGMIGTYELVGAPVHPLLYPMPLRHKLVDLTVWDKINELYNNYYFSYLYEQHVEEENAMLRRIVGDDMPSIAELINNVQMDLKSYLDSSKNGVIYFSLGTNVIPSTLPPEKIQLFLKVFSKLPYDVLWKFDKDELPGQPANVKLQKWLPQSDLLRHPKIKLFITQAGLQSTDEAITAVVPLVAIPMLGDQWYNTERYVQFKIGTKLDLKTLTEEIFKNALETVLGDESYHRNIKKLGKVLTDQPQRLVERAAWWTEHVLRHGGEHLRSVTAVTIVVFIVYTLCRFFCYNVTSAEMKKS